MNRFEKHKKDWFTNRIGKLLKKEPTALTPAAIVNTNLTNVIMICSDKHAASLYNFHRDYKINFKEA